MKRGAIYIVIMGMAMGMVGCQPDGVLSSRQMRALLYDLHRADGILQVAGYNYGHETEVSGYYQSVLRAHGVTQAQFDSSLVWYTNHPERFDKIYPKVLERFKAEVEQSEAMLAEEMVLRDENALEKQISEEEKQVRVEELAEKLRITQAGYPNPWQIWRPEIATDTIIVRKK